MRGLGIEEVKNEKITKIEMRDDRIEVCGCAFDTFFFIFYIFLI